MPIRFRPATPQDVDAVVPLMYASGPPSFEYVFKVSDQKDAQTFLHYAFVREGNEFSYKNYTCMVDDDDQVIGIGASFSSDAVAGFTINTVRCIFGCYGLLNGIKVLRRGLAIEKIIAPPKGNTDVLVHLAILREWRGRGYGSKLIKHFIEKSKTNNRTSTSLDVSLENPRAMALYEREGYIVTKENISTLKNEFSYVASHYKMHREN